MSDSSAFRLARVSSVWYPERETPHRPLSHWFPLAMSTRRPLSLPITLGVVMIVLLVVLTVGWVLVRRSGAGQRTRSPASTGRFCRSAHRSSCSAGRGRGPVPGPFDQGDQPQPAAVELHRQRHPRTEVADRLDEALPADAQSPPGQRRSNRRTFTARCSRTSSGSTN